jgi:hypothetical protein
MKSPFPGMDPFIEGHGHLWPDFHDDLIGLSKAVISAALPPNFVVQRQPRVYLLLNEQEGKAKHAFVPDVGTFSTGRPQGAAREGAVALADPATATEDPQTLRAFVAEEYR